MPPQSRTSARLEGDYQCERCNQWYRVRYQDGKARLTTIAFGKELTVAQGLDACAMCLHPYDRNRLHRHEKGGHP